MKVTNEQVINFMNSGINYKKLPVKLAYAVALNIKNMTAAVEAYMKQREELIKEHAKKNEDGAPLVEDNKYVFEDKEKWDSSINELLQAEAEVIVTTVPAEVLDKCDEAAFDSLSVGELMILSFMIE